MGKLIVLLAARSRFDMCVALASVLALLLVIFDVFDMWGVESTYEEMLEEMGQPVAALGVIFDGTDDEADARRAFGRLQNLAARGSEIKARMRTVSGTAYARRDAILSAFEEQKHRMETTANRAQAMQGRSRAAQKVVEQALRGFQTDAGKSQDLEEMMTYFPRFADSPD